MNEAKKGNIEVLDKDLTEFWSLIRDFVVLGIQYKYQTTVYQGTHPKFETLKMGDIIPNYDIIINKKKYKLKRI